MPHCLMRHHNTVLAAFVLLALTGLALLSVFLLMPPKPIPATAPSEVFSAERAMQHVNRIAAQPHAMGTAAHAQVRAYLLQQMKELGLNPQVQETLAADDQGTVANVGYVYNLLGRVKGTGGGKEAILLVAHYDSQPNTLGAGDDAAGVAAILETVRALQHSEPLQQDVIVLLTDGEEYGLFGARAFLKHPWAREVALVLNVEARGNKGPSMTFELSPQNGWIARQFIEAAPYPFVSSLAYEIYSRMPNDTDFTIFKDAGYTGLNSAFIGGLAHYHKATDSPENLSRESLQHHGSNMLALVRHFGQLSLSQTKAPDTVFFNFINGWVIHYRLGLNVFFVALGALLLLVTIKVALRKKMATGKQVIAGVGAYLLLLVAVAGLFIPVNGLVLSLLPSGGLGGVYGADQFFIAYLLLAVGLFILLSWLVLRWLPLFPLLLGVFILQFVLMGVLALLVPAAVYLLLFPLLFGLGGVLLVLLQELHQKPEKGWGYALILLLAALPAIFIIMPIAYSVFLAFELQMPVASMALLTLLLGLLLPLLVLLERSYHWRFVPLLPLVLLVVGVLQVWRAVAGEQPSAETPLHSQVAYYLNADTGKAYWVSGTEQLDEWKQQFFTAAQAGPLEEVYPHAQRRQLKNQAEPLALAPPAAQVLADSVVGDERMLRLRLYSPRGAAHLEVILQPGTTDTLQSIKLGGREVHPRFIPAPSGNVYHIRYYGLPISKEAELEVRLKTGVPLHLLLYDHTLALPQELVRQPMPPHIIPSQGRDSNLTVVRQQYTF